MHLRIFIDGEWSVENFSVALHCYNTIYEVYRSIYLRGALLDELFEFSDQNPGKFNYEDTLFLEKALGLQGGEQEASKLVEYLDQSFPRLMVKEMHFASPGTQDLTGLGKILEQLRLSVKDWRNRRSDVRIANAEAALAEERVDEAKIKNMSDFFALCKQNGFSKSETLELWGKISDANTALVPMIANGQVQGAEMVDPKRLTAPTV